MKISVSNNDSSSFHCYYNKKDEDISLNTSVYNTKYFLFHCNYNNQDRDISVKTSVYNIDNSTSLNFRKK